VPTKQIEAYCRVLAREIRPQKIILFGSYASGSARADSDVDLLVVLKGPSELKIRNRISRMILDVNLKYDTNLSSIVVERQAWDEGPLSVLPIHEEIEEEGIRL